jgi:predicted dehydrogenase
MLCVGPVIIYDIGMPTPIRVGVVGIHAFARDHFNHLLPLHVSGEYQVAAAVAHQRELDPAWAGQLEARGVRLLPDLDALLAEPGLELVTLPVGIPLHLAFARRVLAAGKACFLEKPVGATLCEAEALGRAQRAAGVPLFIGFQDLFHPAAWELKRRLLAGAVGRIRRITVTAAWPRATGYYARNRWAGRLALDGAPVNDSPVNNACAHFLAIALFLAGASEAEPAWPLTVRGGLWRGHSIESFDTGSLAYATDSGVEVVFTVSHVSEKDWGPVIRIDGDAGSVTNDDLLHDAPWLLPGGAKLDTTGRLEARFRHVASVLRGGSAPVCTLVQARAHSAAVELLHATLPIRDLPAAKVQRNGEAVVCPGIDALLRTAHQRGVTLDALGFPG